MLNNDVMQPRSLHCFSIWFHRIAFFFAEYKCRCDGNALNLFISYIHKFFFLIQYLECFSIHWHLYYHSAKTLAILCNRIKKLRDWLCRYPASLSFPPFLNVSKKLSNTNSKDKLFEENLRWKYKLYSDFRACSISVYELQNFASNCEWLAKA